MSLFYYKKIKKEVRKMDIYPRISNKVSKLGVGIGTLNLPAITTCRTDAPCRSGCYACKGNFMYSAVKTGLQRNLDAFNEDADRFFFILDNQLNMIPFKFFRWHSSGDIVNERYLEGMCWLARKHKGTQFLCFTKKYELVNEYLKYHKKPKNLILVLSNWGEWICENPHNLPTAWVEFGKESDNLIPESANRCNGNCGTCVNTSEHCWRMQKGDAVYFHKH